MNSKSMAGWIGFAGILMLIVGMIDFFQGLIGLFIVFGLLYWAVSRLCAR